MDEDELLGERTFAPITYDPAGFLQVNGVIPETSNCALMLMAAAQIPRPAKDKDAKPYNKSNVFQAGFFMYPRIQRFIPWSMRCKSPVAGLKASSDSMASF